MHTYLIAGLAVESEFVLPALTERPIGDSRPDVSVRRGGVPHSLDDTVLSGPNWVMADGRFLLCVPGVARFLLIAGSEILIELENDTPFEDASIFLLGSAFGMLLHQRNQVVLHASAVEVNGMAVLFCGRSGAGKSTLAAALGQCGYPLVTDDMCSIEFADLARPIVHPDGRRLKLWQQAIDKLQLGESRGTAVRNRVEKFFVAPMANAEEPLPLGAIYALSEPHPPLSAGIRRPNIVDAAQLLRRSAFRPALVRRMGQRGRYFEAASAIMRTAGVFHLRRSFDFTELPTTIGWLERHWSEIGLTAEKAA